MKLRYTLLVLVCMFSSTTTLADVHPIVGTSIIGTSIIGTSIIGTWALEVSAPRGVQHPTLNVAGDKDSYHGVLTGRRGQLPIKEMQVEENTFSFPLKVPTPMGEFELHYRGQIDGDLMQGKIDTPRGSIPFTGKRTR